MVTMIDLMGRGLRMGHEPAILRFSFSRGLTVSE